MLDAIVFLGGDTSRSRCYLQALAAAGVIPTLAALLPGASRPGQIAAAAGKTVAAPWGSFDPEIPAGETCAASGVRVVNAPNGDVNSSENREFLANLPGTVFIYSGFGGVILRRETLGVGKRFLHVHGGWLPEYKGSTTNHYSLLAEGFCAASAIFLAADIDCGEILARRKFPPPPDARELDHIWDGIFRAEVLLDVVAHYIRHGAWPSAGAENARTEPYYIMHPLLRHVLLERYSSLAPDAGK